MTSVTASPDLAAAALRRRAPWARLGFAGFLFFLAKGLLWLIVPAVLWLVS